MLIALTFALFIALGLGAAAYTLSKQRGGTSFSSQVNSGAFNADPEFLFFTIFSFCYLIWATLPLSVGSSRQFDPERLLVYPISLRKLFAIDLFSEITTFQSIFAIPSIVAIGLGVGMAKGQILRALLIIIPTFAFGIALAKWLATATSSLLRQQRTRGETLVAMIGATVGLGGALIAQVAPSLIKNQELLRAFRWTPPGMAAFALTEGMKGTLSNYVLPLLGLAAYTALLVIMTFWMARRVVLGEGGGKGKPWPRNGPTETTGYGGWRLPLLSSPISAIVEKELKYSLRNAQLRIMAVMPLMLILVRLANVNRLGVEPGMRSGPFFREFLTYGEGLVTTAGVLYVFLILSGLSCNHFAFDNGGMRALILSPIKRRDILLGKNISSTLIALAFSVTLLTIDQVVFKDLTIRTLLFVGLSFISFAAIMSLIGNWLSIRFPRRMKFGKHLSVSGLLGLLLIPLTILLSLPPLAATAVGYLTQSLLVEYVTLAVVTGLSVGYYLVVIDNQSQLLQAREIEILDAIREQT